jgi:hypothetical protein
MAQQAAATRTELELEREAIERQALREKQRAAEAVRHLRQHRDAICRLPYWQQVNRAESCIRDALRAYRFARGNSAIQTFGSVLARRAAELRSVA